MPLSLQESLKFVLQRGPKNKKEIEDANSSDHSASSVPHSVSSWASQSKKGSSSSMKILAKDVVGAFGSCFSPSKDRHEDSEISLVGIPIASTSSDKGSQQSIYAHNINQSAEQGNGVITFTMAELIKATGNFSPSLKIGQGGFGIVYKGRLNDGRLVAIKRGKKSAFDKQLSAEFRTELAILSDVEHLSLVKFIGYFEEEDERILVVEYVPNGNLREHLDGQYGAVLDLATRLDIIIDVAHALTYLHSYADRSIIHRDIKSSNVLLTENFRAKMADFGFSRLGPWERGATHVSTQVKGTAGYLDPEYLKSYQLTQKSDVYSFGVLIVEIITGRSPIEEKRPTKERITVTWAFQMFCDGKAIETLDPKLEKTSVANLLVEKLFELAFQCAAPTRNERPTMKRTAELLWNIRKDYRDIV